MAQSFRDLMTLRDRPAADGAAGARARSASSLVDASSGGCSHVGATAETRIISPVLLPSPGEVVRSVPVLFSERALVESTVATLKRVLSGFGLAILVGVPLGILAGSYRLFDAVTGPLSLFARNIPVAVLIPLTILWFGIDETQKTMFIFIATAPFVFFDAARAVIERPRALRRDRTDARRVAARRSSRKCSSPLALPDIFSSLRSLFGLAFGYIMLAELVNAKYGLGYLLMTSQRRGAHRAHLRDPHSDRAARLRDRPACCSFPARPVPVPAGV